MQVIEYEWKVPSDLRVLQIIQTFDHSFILLTKQPKGSTLLHLTSKGQTIHQYAFQGEYFQQILQLDPQRIMLFLSKQGKMMIIDLLNQSKNLIDEKQTIDDTCLLYFNDSTTICVCRLFTNEKRIQFTYYQNFDFQNPAFVYEFTGQSKEQIKTAFTFTGKGNQDSLVCFLRKVETEQNKYTMLLHDIEKVNGKFQSRVREIQLPVLEDIKLLEEPFSITEVRPNKIIFASHGNNSSKIYVINSEDSSFREIKCRVPTLNYSLSQLRFMKDFICLRGGNSILNQKGKIETNTMYFINVDTQNIDMSIKCHHLADSGSQQAINFDGIAMIDSGKFWETFSVRKIIPFPRKDMYMDMLLHINEDFDDDMLFDCMKILASIEEQ